MQYRQTGGSDASRRDSEHSSEAKLLKINIYISMFNSTKLIKYRRDNVIRSREIYHLSLDNHYRVPTISSLIFKPFNSSTFLLFAAKNI